MARKGASGKYNSQNFHVDLEDDDTPVDVFFSGDFDEETGKNFDDVPSLDEHFFGEPVTAQEQHGAGSVSDLDVLISDAIFGVSMIESMGLRYPGDDSIADTMRDAGVLASKIPDPSVGSNTVSNVDSAPLIPVHYQSFIVDNADGSEVFLTMTLWASDSLYGFSLFRPQGQEVFSFFSEKGQEIVLDDELLRFEQDVEPELVYMTESAHLRSHVDEYPRSVLIAMKCAPVFSDYEQVLLQGS